MSIRKKHICIIFHCIYKSLDLKISKIFIYKFPIYDRNIIVYNYIEDVYFRSLSLLSHKVHYPVDYSVCPFQQPQNEVRLYDSCHS